jgi:hypothetical protein
MVERRRVSKIVKVVLSDDHSERIRELREIAGRLPFHERYIAGEFRGVWAELSTLGEEVRYDAYAIDALAVAYETMHRAAANVGMIINRLQAIDYEFRSTVFAPYWKTSLADAATREVLEGRLEQLAETARSLGPPEQLPPELIEYWKTNLAREEERAIAAQERRMGIVRPHMAPERTTDLWIKRVVQAAGAIPFSLRAWYKTVGGVNLVGSHPELAPPGTDCDPLFVAPFQFVLDLCQAWVEEHVGEVAPAPFQLPISPHRIAKAGRSIKAPLYVASLPNADLDAILENEPHKLHFVEYLRLAFEWGGFPGYADLPRKAPKMIAALKDGLVPL